MRVTNSRLIKYLFKIIAILKIKEYILSIENKLYICEFTLTDTYLSYR